MAFRPYKRYPRREFSVTHMSGPLDGKKLPFSQPPGGEERVLLIGRREGSDIHLPFDSQVSRIHAKVGCVAMGSSSDPDGGGVLTFWLEDGGSRNGTFVEKDDEPIISRISLRPGTLFRIGRTWLRLDPLLS